MSEKVQMDDLKRLFEDARTRGRGSHAYLKFAEAMFDLFPLIYETAKSLQDDANTARLVLSMLKEPGTLISLQSDYPDRDGNNVSALAIRAGWNGWMQRVFTGRNLPETLTLAHNTRLSLRAQEKAHVCNQP